MPAGQIGMALVTVLGVADAVAQYALTLMMTYLTNVWELGLKKSATIVNLYSGTVAILPLGIHFIAQVREGDYWTLVFSSFSYMAGFVLLTMSTPTILARVTGSTCSTHKPQCIGQVHRILYYTALPLIAVGVSGYSVSREKFVSRQWGGRSPPVSVIAVLFLLGTVGVTAVGYANPWWIKFGIPSGFILLATLIFLSASSFYDRSNAQDEFPLGKRDIKATMYMSFFCIVFTIVGVVSSTGNTYFMEAADSMDGKIRGFKVPVLILPFLSTSVKYATVKFGQKCPAVIRIIVAGVLATLCCFAAAIVENQRLRVVKSHGLIDKPDETVPMSMFWLIPQFLLLGAAGGLLESGVTALYTGSVLAEPLRWGLTLDHGMEGGPAYQHGLKCVKAFYGVGIIGSVLFVLGVSKIEPSWFHHTLNASRLDDYYWTLAVFTAADSLLLGLLWGAWLKKPWRHVGPSALLTSFYKPHYA